MDLKHAYTQNENKILPKNIQHFAPSFFFFFSSSSS
jgi:hypothetical protein